MASGGASVGSGRPPPPTRVTTSRTSPGRDRRLGVAGPGDEVAVPLDGHVLGLDAEVPEQVGDRQGLGDVAPFAVQRDRHGKFRRFSSGVRGRRTCAILDACSS